MLFCAAAWGQTPYDTVNVYDPQNFTEMTTMDVANFQFIGRKNSLNRRMHPDTLRKWITPDVLQAWIGDPLDSVDVNSAYWDQFVTDSLGRVWFVDSDGDAKKLRDPNESLVGTGSAGYMTYWNTGTTITNTDIAYTSTLIDADMLTGAFGFPVGTTAQRPLVSTGRSRFNSDLGDLEFYNGSAWRSLPESSANAFTAGQFIIANPAGILSDTTAAGVLSMIGGVGGTGASPQVAYWSGTSTLTGHANFLWDGSQLSVGTTNSDYTLDVGTGGVRYAPQSAAITGAAGAGYYDSDDNWYLGHNGTGFFFYARSDDVDPGAGRLWFQNSANTAQSTSSLLIWDGDQMAVNSSTVEASSALVVNGNIRARNAAGDNTGELYLHNNREDIYLIDTDNNGLSLHTNDPAGAKINFFQGNTRFASTNNSYFQQDVYTSFTETSGADVTLQGFNTSSGDGGDAVVQAGRGSASNNNGGSVFLKAGYNNSGNFSGGYTGVPGYIEFSVWSDTAATAAASQHRVVKITGGAVSGDAEFGRVQFQKYGDGLRTGTPTYYSAWDTDGKFVEVSPASFGVVGTISTSTDGSGDVTVTHGMGTTPTVVLVTPTGTTAWICTVHTIGATTFKVRFFDAAGAAVTTTAVTASWLGKT